MYILYLYAYLMCFCKGFFILETLLFLYYTENFLEASFAFIARLYVVRLIKVSSMEFMQVIKCTTYVYLLVCIKILLLLYNGLLDI